MRLTVRPPHLLVGLVFVAMSAAPTSLVSGQAPAGGGSSTKRRPAADDAATGIYASGVPEDVVNAVRAWKKEGASLQQCIATPRGFIARYITRDGADMTGWLGSIPAGLHAVLTKPYGPLRTFALSPEDRWIILKGDSLWAEGVDQTDRRGYLSVFYNIASLYFLNESVHWTPRTHANTPLQFGDSVSRTWRETALHFGRAEMGTLRVAARDTNVFAIWGVGVQTAYGSPGVQRAFDTVAARGQTVECVAFWPNGAWLVVAR